LDIFHGSPINFPLNLLYFGALFMAMKFNIFHICYYESKLQCPKEIFKLTSFPGGWGSVGVESRALCVLGTYTTTDLHPPASQINFLIASMSCLSDGILMCTLSSFL
jgi:hypothetical protein